MKTQRPGIRPTKVVALLRRRCEAEAENAFRDRSDAVIDRLASVGTHAEGLFIILNAKTGGALQLSILGVTGVAGLKGAASTGHAAGHVIAAADVEANLGDFAVVVDRTDIGIDRVTALGGDVGIVKLAGRRTGIDVGLIGVGVGFIGVGVGLISVGVGLIGIGVGLIGVGVGLIGVSVGLIGVGVGLIGVAARIFAGVEFGVVVILGIVRAGDRGQ